MTVSNYDIALLISKGFEFHLEHGTIHAADIRVLQELEFILEGVAVDAEDFAESQDGLGDASASAYADHAYRNLDIVRNLLTSIETGV